MWFFFGSLSIFLIIIGRFLQGLKEYEISFFSILRPINIDFFVNILKELMVNF